MRGSDERPPASSRPRCEVTRPGPLGVECPFCKSKPYEPCAALRDGEFQYYYSVRDGCHASREIAAEQARREKEENRG